MDAFAKKLEEDLFSQTEQNIKQDGKRILDCINAHDGIVFAIYGSESLGYVANFVKGVNPNVFHDNEELKIKLADFICDQAAMCDYLDGWEEAVKKFDLVKSVVEIITDTILEMDHPAEEI